LTTVSGSPGITPEAADNLKAAMTTALGPNWALVEDQLRQELGHDLTPDHS
jgi:hypothetical protein